MPISKLTSVVVVLFLVSAGCSRGPDALAGEKTADVAAAPLPAPTADVEGLAPALVPPAKLETVVPAAAPTAVAKPAEAAVPSLPSRQTPTPTQTEAPPATLSFASLPAGPGRDVTQRLCSNCHAIDVVIARRRTADDWSSIVNQMVNLGLVASDDELDAVEAYLSQHVAP